MLTKKWASAAICASLLASLVACTTSPSQSAAPSTSTSSEPGPDTSAPSGDPITIGVLGPNSGGFADAGLNFLQGATIAADQINAKGGVLGRPIQIEQKDTVDGPQASSQAVRDFVSDGTNFLLGELSSANCLAAAPLVDQLGAIFITGICSVPELTGAKGEPAPYKNLFRTGATSDTMVYGLAKVMGDKFPAVSLHDSFAFDYVTGHLQWDQYRDIYQQAGKEISVDKEMWVPMDQQNYSSHISVLAQASTGAEKKGLYLGLYGAGVASFLQQSAPYDFLKNYEFVVIPGEYYSIARDMGGSAPEIWNSYEYNWAAYDTPENDAFVADFEALAGKKPITWSYVSYLAVLAYAAAIEKAGSTEPADVVKALEGISFASPQGEYSIEATGHNGSSNMTVTHSVGDPNDPEKIKMIETIVVPATETPTFTYQ